MTMALRDQTSCSALTKKSSGKSAGMRNHSMKLTRMNRALHWQRRASPVRVSCQGEASSGCASSFRHQLVTHVKRSLYLLKCNTRTLVSIEPELGSFVPLYAAAKLDTSAPSPRFISRNDDFLALVVPSRTPEFVYRIDENDYREQDNASARNRENKLDDIHSRLRFLLRDVICLFSAAILAQRAA